MSQQAAISAQTQITIRRADFTEAQWIEAFNTHDGFPEEQPERDFEFQANASVVEEMAHCCREKAKYIKRGGMGPQTKRGENKAWIADLNDAACVLENYLGI